MLRATAGRTEKSSQNKTIRVSFALFSMTLLSEVRRTRSPSRRSKTDLRDGESGRPDSVAAQANQIAPSGQRSRKSQSDRSLQTTKPYKPTRSLFQDSKAVQANRIALSGQQSRISQSDRSVRTAKPYNSIGSLLQDSKAVQANQIAPSGQRSCTSQSDHSLLTAKL